MAEEEVLGKAYDSRLMKRLLGYLRPYWWQSTVTLAACKPASLRLRRLKKPFLTSGRQAAK